MLRAPFSEGFTLFEKGCSPQYNRHSRESGNPPWRELRSSRKTCSRNALFRVGRKQSVLGSPACDLGPRTEPQLAEDFSDVVACGAPGDPELGGDLAVGEAPRNQDRHLPLASGEAESRFAGRRFLGCRARRRIGLVPEENV